MPPPRSRRTWRRAGCGRTRSTRRYSRGTWTSRGSPTWTCSSVLRRAADSNFLIWQSAYAEFVFLDTLFPDFDRRHLWHACEIYASRDRRYGGAVPNPPPAAVRAR